MAQRFIEQQREDIIARIVAMGYPYSYAKKAFDQVGDPTLPNAFELCFHWMEENPMSFEEENNHQMDLLLAPLEQMGFSRFGLSFCLIMVMVVIMVVVVIMIVIL